MRASTAVRGQPLLVLATLLAAWLALRIALWQPAPGTALLATPNVSDFELGMPEAVVSPTDRAVTAGHGPDGLARFSNGRLHAAWPVRSPAPFFRAAAMPQHAANGLAGMASPHGARAAVGHNLLLAAALSQLELPMLAAYLLAPPSSRPGSPAAAPLLTSLPQEATSEPDSRWSADAWLMMRQDNSAAGLTGRPSYGRSQAGGVVRYRLAPSSPHSPQAYARASSALAGPLERDLVAGLSARPVPRLPLRVAIEARISETAQGTEVRPAAIAVTELPPLRLPGGLRGEAYLQGGYVGGRFATAFADGQARVERSVARFGRAELTAGAGAWGGTQEGASRLDVGPTAAVSFRLGEARGRVAADYRFRVAGEAEPASGPALTLSAGF